MTDIFNCKENNWSKKLFKEQAMTKHFDHDVDTVFDLSWMFRIYGQGTLQNCEESKAFFSLNQSFNHFRVPPGAVGSKTKRIERKISRNILLRYVLCQVLGRLSPSLNSLNIRTEPRHTGIILWQSLTNESSQLSPPNCRSHPPPVSHCCCCCCVVECFCPTDVVSAVAALAVDWVSRRRQLLNVRITNIPIC